MKMIQSELWLLVHSSVNGCTVLEEKESQYTHIYHLNGRQSRGLKVSRLTYPFNPECFGSIVLSADSSELGI